MKPIYEKLVVAVLLTGWVGVGCQSQSPSEGVSLPDVALVDPKNSGQPSEPSPPSDLTGGNPSATRDVLLFNGTGVSTSDWQATEQIIQGQGWTYALANSAQLNAMSLDELASYRLLVVPGGKGGTITSALTQEARLRVRSAVQERGVGYVGFCAGAWIAVGPEATTQSVASYGLAVALGSVLPSYWPNQDTSLTAAMVKVTFADQTSRQLVWWGGPSTPEWPQGVVARYITGEPAISQTWSGKGLVVIAGPHPEAPQSWRSTAGFDSDGLDEDIAVDMMKSAMLAQPMASYP